MKGPGFQARHSYEVQAEEQGTKVTMTGAFSGVIGSLVGRFMKGSVRRDLRDELAAIKQAAEAKG